MTREVRHGWVHWFPVAAIANHHRPSSLKQEKFMLRCSRGQKPEIKLSWACHRRLQGDPSLSLPASRGSGNPWPCTFCSHLTPRCASVFMWPSFWGRFMFPVLMRSPVAGSDPLRFHRTSASLGSQPHRPHCQ
jgi:hypothetical protein